MSTPHIADREVDFLVVNISPDFCKVFGKVVPFDIYRDLSHDKAGYSQTMRARGQPVLKVGSVVSGVVGNMGKGVLSGVSLGTGNVLTIAGSATVHVEGKPICRHDDLCLMNGK